MKMIGIIPLLAISIFLFNDCEQIKSVRTLGSSEFTAKNFKTEIPFETRLGLIAIKVGLNGSKDDYDFVFDTGAGASMISKRVADSLKLEKKGEINVSDALGHTTKNVVVAIKELDINGLKFYNWGAIVSDVGKYSPIKCVGKDGIIGVNILADCNWVVNYDKKTLTATDSDLRFPANATVIPFSSYVPHVEMKVGQEVFKNVIVDLGSNETITIPEKEVVNHHHINISNTVYRKIDGSSQGLNGAREDTVQVYNSDSVMISNKLYSHINIITAKNLLLKIGANFWDKHVFGLDYKNHKIFLSDNIYNSSDQNFTKGFGFRVGIKDDKYVINTLFSNSPATDAGIKMGDEIVELNGKPIREMFPNYCDGFFWQKDIMDKEEQVTLKTNRMNSAIVLKNEQYGRVKK